MVSTSNITEFSKRKPPKKSKKLSAANIQNIREAAAAAKRKRNAKDEAKRKRGRSIPRRMKNTAVSTARYVKRKITGKSKYKNLTKYEENRAASKIQAAARGYMARKAVIGLTAAQKRAAAEYKARQLAAKKKGGNSNNAKRKGAAAPAPDAPAAKRKPVASAASSKAKAKTKTRASAKKD